MQVTSHPVFAVHGDLATISLTNWSRVVGASHGPLPFQHRCIHRTHKVLARRAWVLDNQVM
jgi:hypothetical protein